MLHRNAIAFDPGKTTGVATLLRGKFNGFELGGSFKEKAAEIEKALTPGSWGKWDYVIYEKYIITNRTAKLTQQHEPLMLIGVIEHFAEAAIGQTPSAGKQFATDDLLKAVGWWMPTPGGHIQDAARHLLKAGFGLHFLPDDVVTKATQYTLEETY